MQRAIGAPVTEQLDHWKNTTVTDLPLPFNNKVIGMWRDERRVADSVNFNPKELEESQKLEKRMLYEQSSQQPINNH